MRVSHPDLMVCADCLVMIANGEDSGMSGSQLDRVLTGLRQFAADGVDLAAGDEGRDEEFSSRPCDCCGQYLAGARHHVVGLSHEPEPKP